MSSSLGMASNSSRLADVVCVVCWCSFAGAAASAASRLKRELRLPKGGSFVVAVALASALPKGPTDGFFHVLEFDLGFPFPDKIVLGEPQNEKKIWKNRREHISRKTGRKAPKKHPRRSRRQLHLKENQKQKLLLRMEDAITRAGFNGPSCISRFLCELRHVSPESSLLEELLSALFTPSSSDNKGCQHVHPQCPVSLLHLLMHSEQVPPSYAEFGHQGTEAWASRDGATTRQHLSHPSILFAATEEIPAMILK